ncbi:PAS and ANTAR domain-containing protein [Paenarthrobacter nitroguajacolicus]|uniref:PAS and ANTAR domain-containing protein n=1 Tax=Paenarthrobacter nitroguajacolicus TaxID=211146 RepID=UPI0015BCD4BD|nr:PAS and ANTAR domain-containing protein [Paenarthrobacter nitroguajacolicus]
MSGLNFLDNIAAASEPWQSFLVGVFHHEGQRMRWSEETYKLFGFTPGEVVPTPALMLSHVHPLDRVAVERLWMRASLGAAQFCAAFRLIDASGLERRVLMYGQGLGPGQGDFPVVQGCLFDLTDLFERELRRTTREAVLRATRSHESVDKAVGILMCHLGITADAALRVLMTGSSHTNIKVRELADELVNIVEANPSGRGIDAFLKTLRPQRPAQPRLQGRQPPGFRAASPPGLGEGASPWAGAP